jgi:hypothetical protein
VPPLHTEILLKVALTTITLFLILNGRLPDMTPYRMFLDISVWSEEGKKI